MAVFLDADTCLREKRGDINVRQRERAATEDGCDNRDDAGNQATLAGAKVIFDAVRRGGVVLVRLRVGELQRQACLTAFDDCAVLVAQQRAFQTGAGRGDGVHGREFLAWRDRFREVEGEDGDVVAGTLSSLLVSEAEAPAIV